MPTHRYRERVEYKMSGREGEIKTCFSELNMNIWVKIMAALLF
jgi:hypothetical protein